MQLYLDVDATDVISFNEKIAENVKKYRIEKKITQTELAFAIGLKSVSSIGKIEARLENKHYSVENLYKISKVLDIKICSFFP